jgi:two-component system nitrate/nitrite response regulator NarL
MMATAMVLPGLSGTGLKRCTMEEWSRLSYGLPIRHIFPLPAMRAPSAGRHDAILMPIRALLVDDNATFLASARRLLEREGIVIVDEASTGAQALRSSEEHDPDVILVDVDLGEESGFDLAERFSASQEERRPVIMISAYPEDDLEDLLRTSSAIGFVSKAELSARAIVDLLGRAGRDDQTYSV